MNSDAVLKLINDQIKALEAIRADLAVAQQQRSRAHLDELLSRVEQGARAVERGKIIAWLRDGADIDWEPASLQIADAIERGDHLREWGQK